MCIQRLVRFRGLRQLPVVISLPTMRRLSERAASAKCDAPVRQRLGLGAPAVEMRLGQLGEREQGTCPECSFVREGPLTCINAF